MKRKFIIPALGMMLGASSAMAQVTAYDAFPIPEGFKAISASISANGQHAIVGVQDKSGAVKFLQFQKSGGQFAASAAGNPLSGLISQGVTPMNPSLSCDGSAIYFAADNGGHTDIYAIEKENGKWGAKKNLGDSVNTSGSEQYPAISPDGNTLYFTRLRSGGEDARCGVLYMSSLKSDGTWSAAKDVPEPVSLGCEAAPYVCPDGKTIYFSSIREGGKGGFDIYFTKRANEKSWVIPVSIDTINTKENEMSPAFDYGQQQMYIVSRNQKKSDAVNRAEIPGQFKHSPVTRYYGKTLSNGGKPLEAGIEVKDAFSSIVLATYKSDGQTGAYDFFLSDNSPVFIDFSRPGYSHAIEPTPPT